MNNAKGTKSRYLLRLSYDCTQENQKNLQILKQFIGKDISIFGKVLEGGMVIPNTSDYSFINFRSRSNMAL